MQKDFPVNRLELLYTADPAKLKETIVGDIQQHASSTVIRPHLRKKSNRFDYADVYHEMYQLFMTDWDETGTGYPFDYENEDYFVSMATGTHVELICLFQLIQCHYIRVKLLQLIPPDKTQPDDIAGSHNLVDLDHSKYNQLKGLKTEEQQSGSSFLKDGIQTKNRAYNDLIDEIERVVTARTTPVLRRQSTGKESKKMKLQGKPDDPPPPVLPVLLLGETGVGKTQLARLIYELKKERQLLDGEFIHVNCATLRGDNAMSALFGHIEGAFTGAVEKRDGFLKAANGGILFLDEIGELGLEEQAMLLRAIEEKKFQPVGSDKDTSSNFQLIAGTNRDLETEVAAGKFRGDLLARIHLWTFRLPSLAEHREDIEPNIDYELAKYERQYQVKIEFNKEAKKRFLDFAKAPTSCWHGNFRDLNAAIVHMATLSHDGRITIETVGKEIERLEKQWKKLSPGAAKEHFDILAPFYDEEQIKKIDHFDHVQLAEVIRVCRTSRTQTEAGKRLFQHSRTQKTSKNDVHRLGEYLKRFRLSWKQVKKE
jgi:transcriptional regulatory protein RtcR